MAGLKEQAVWENEIYQIEENDPVHGGEDGITNKPAKQLANRTLYLRNLLTLAGQKIVPKTITATSTNTADETGHTHAIDHATTGQKGIVQLTNDTGLDSEALALTAKAGKKLAMDLAALKIVVNGKYNEKAASTTVRGTVQLVDSLIDGSVTKALTARQGKALNDKLNVMKVPPIGGSQEINLDFTSREQIIEQLRPVYRGNGRYYASFYNSGPQHRFQNLPLGTTRGEFELTVSVYGSFSFIEIYYLSLKRRFFTQVNWNNPTLTLNWHESVNQNMAGVVYLHNYDEAYAGGVIVVDEQVDMNRDIPRRKMLSTYEARAGRYTKSVYRTHLLTNKNAEIELSGKDANDAWKRFLTMMTATGNVIVGHNADNGRDRVQINGTVKATAPEAGANNDQLPTTAWVNSALAPKVDKLIEQTLDLKNLRQDKWYPVILKLPNMRQLNYFELRTTLGDGNTPSWANHGAGISLFCQWDTQHAGWGTYDINVGMREIKKFEYLHCNQSPMLKIGQLFQPGYEYFYLRGGASYTLYREAGIAVEIATSPNGYHWQNEDGQYRQHLPLIESYDESLVPKTTRQTLDGFIGGDSYIKRGGDKHDIKLSWDDRALNLTVDATNLGNITLHNDFAYQKIGNFEVRKYPDGTMIQTYRFTPSGERTGAAHKEFSFNWAVAFTEKPKIFPQHINLEPNGFGALDTWINISDARTTNSRVAFWVLENYHNGDRIAFDFMAIGRWK